jgi:parallel beta-helix repeat protein
MKNIGRTYLKSIATVILTGSFLCVGPLSAGPLTKRLEPRQPIFAKMLPLTISQSGSYYLAESISTSGGGITIAASGVTIDLNGFTLEGGAGSGITTTGTPFGIVIQDGTVSRWPGWGIDLTGTLDGEILNVRVERNGNGLRLYQSSVIRGCFVGRNTGIGIQTGVDALVSDSVVSDSTDTGLIAGAGSIVRRTIIQGNDPDGVWLQEGAQLLNSTVKSNHGHGVNATGDSVVIRNNTVQGNGHDGIYVGGNYSLVTGNLCVSNGVISDDSAGIRLVGIHNRADDNDVKNNDIGIFIAGENNVLARNTMDGNTQPWGRDPAVTKWLFRIWTVASPDPPNAWDNIEDGSLQIPPRPD